MERLGRVFLAGLAGLLLAAASRGASFKGRRGFTLRLPPGFSAVSGFTDDQKIQERVQIFPSELDPGSAAFAQELLRNGGLLLDVVPKWFVAKDQNVKSLDDYTALVRQNLAGKGRVEERELSVNGLKGREFVFDAAEFPHSALLEGRKAFYRASSLNLRLLRAVTASIKER